MPKSTSSKRHFKVVIRKKEHGLYCSSSPSSAARKAVSKLCATDKKKKVEFSLREITRESRGKTYGPYLGYIEKLKVPIQLKGRLIEYKPNAKLIKKTEKKITKKTGVKRGGVKEIPKDIKDFMILRELNGNKNKLLEDHKNITLFEQEEYRFLSDIPNDDLKKLFEIIKKASEHAYGISNDVLYDKIMIIQQNNKNRNEKDALKKKYSNEIRKLLEIRTKIIDFFKNNENEYNSLTS